MELYHLLNRGVEKRDIFLDTYDRDRFVFGLEIFNDTRRIDNVHRLVNGSEVRLTKSNKQPLVEIHGWCLMKNHYHLLVSERAKNGITQFIRKLNIGHSKYFNTRYQRSGTLFQGRTKKVLISQDAHFLHILHYIHLNPLDFLHGAHYWRQGKISGVTPVLKHLEEYRWSSYLDYCGKSNFPNILSKKLFKDVYPNYPKTIRKFLDAFEIESIKNFTLE